jgi:integrase
MIEIKKIETDENWCLCRGVLGCVQDTLSYAVYLKGVKRRSVDGTIHGKMTSLKYWYEYLDEIGKGVNDFITTREQSGFVDFLDRQENKQKVKPLHVVGKGKYGTGFSPKTTVRHQSNVYQYYQYLGSRNRTSLEAQDYPFKEIVVVKGWDIKDLPKTIEKSDVRKMINACNCLRDKLIIFFMFSVGLRLGELCSLTMSVIDIAHGTINMDRREYLDLETGTLKTGPRRLKGNRLLFELFHRYCVFERDRVAECDNVFVNLTTRGGANRGGPMNRGAIEALFKRIKKKTGLKVCHPHALRHTFSTNFLRLREKNDKVTIGKLQKLLGHADIKTTMMYTHLDYTDFDKELGGDYEAYLDDSMGDILW